MLMKAWMTTSSAQTDDDEEPEAVGRALGEHERADAERREEHQHDHRAEHAELLTDHGEDEVGVRFGEIEELLARRPEPQAEDAAAAQCEQRLHDVEAGILRVFPRIEKGQNARALVGARADGERDRRQQREYGEGDVLDAARRRRTACRTR